MLQAGIKVMAIADHNSVKGLMKRKEAAAKLNIKYILVSKLTVLIRESTYMF